MTEIQSEEAQETNGEDQEELRPQPAWERYGMSQEDYFHVAGQSSRNMRKLSNAELRVERAGELLALLMEADGTKEGDDYDLTVRAIYMLKQVRSLLKSAVKKIGKYENQQRARDIANWSKPRNLKLGTDRGKEQKELVKRLDALPRKDAMEVINMVVNLELSKSEGDEERRKEIFELLETQPVPWVNAYAHLAGKDLIQLTPKIDGADATAQ